MHKTLKNWSAKRAGAAITVRGSDVHNGEAVKLTGIVAIEATASGIHAVDRAGLPHRLLLV